jgi:hypothetical protein
MVKVNVIFNDIRALKLKSHFAAGVLGDSICFGIFVVYQFHPGT